MKKTLTSLRGTFNRFQTNNPIKTEMSAINAPIIAGVIAAPLDMGLTLILCGSSAFGSTLFYATIAGLERSSNIFNHKDSRTISYQGDAYVMSVAQAYRYDELEEKKREAQKIYNKTANVKLQKKLLKKAQKWSNIQDDLLDGANVFKASEKPTPPPFEVSRKARTPGN